MSPRSTFAEPIGKILKLWWWTQRFSLTLCSCRSREILFPENINGLYIHRWYKSCDQLYCKSNLKALNKKCETKNDFSMHFWKYLLHVRLSGFRTNRAKRLSIWPQQRCISEKIGQPHRHLITFVAIGECFIVLLYVSSIVAQVNITHLWNGDM